MTALGIYAPGTPPSASISDLTSASVSIFFNCVFSNCSPALILALRSSMALS
jgi:hypothetical protein